MSNELVLTGDLSQFNPALAEQLGLKSSFNGPINTLPRLQVNRHFEDDDGNTLVPGAFHLRTYVEDAEGASVPKDYFSAKMEVVNEGKPPKGVPQPIQLRIFANMFQVQHYDQSLPEGQRFVNKTILVPDFSKEMIDEKGGTRCGKIMGKKARANYTKEELEADAKIKKTFRFLYGQVKMDHALTLNGDATSVDWTPFYLRLGGSNFMDIGDHLESLTKQNKMPYNYIFTASTERHKNGDVVYYEVKWDLDMANTVPVTKADGDLMVDFMKTINAENAEVRKKYDAALKGKPTNDDAAAAAVLDALGAGNSLDSDLDDEIPL